MNAPPQPTPNLTRFEQELIKIVRLARHEKKTITYTIVSTHGIIRLFRTHELISDNGKVDTSQE